MNGHKLAISSASILHLFDNVRIKQRGAWMQTHEFDSLEREKIRRLMDLSFVLYENSVTSLVHEK